MTIFHHDILGLIPVRTRSRKRDYLPSLYTLKLTPIPPYKRIRIICSLSDEDLAKRMGFAACVVLSQKKLFMAK